MTRSRTLEPGTVDLWRVAVFDGIEGWPQSSDVLSNAERAHAARFDRGADRARFVATRIAVRAILAAYLGRSPACLGFTRGWAGKPYLVDGGDAVSFNVAHSHRLALVAVGASVDVGVDIEHRRSLDDLETVAASALSPAEWMAWASLPMAERTLAFLRWWTCKEAYLKACGDGLGRRLDAVDVQMGSDGRPRIGMIRDQADDEREWTLLDVDVGLSYVATVAVRSPDVVLRCLDWPSDANAR